MLTPLCRHPQVHWGPFGATGVHGCTGEPWLCYKKAFSWGKCTSVRNATMRRCYGVKRVFIKSRCRHGRLWELEGGLEMPKWNPSTGIRIEPRCSPTRIRIEWDPKGIQLESNWNPTGIEMGSKGDSNGLHMEPNNPNGIRMESKWNSSPSGHWGQLGATAAH